LSYVFLNPICEENGEPVEEQVKDIEYARVDMVLNGVNFTKDQITRTDGLGYENFYLAQCPDGIINVPTTREITIANVWPGIDWVIYGISDKGLKHDFVVHPGADPSLIQMKYKWADVRLDNDGKLHISCPIGEIIESIPATYLEETNTQINSSFKMIGKTEVGFNIGAYDNSKTLVVDPALTWGTFYGGTSLAGGRTCTTDGAGNLYVTGYTNSVNFPLLNPGGGAYFQGALAGGTWDYLIIKFSNAGVLLWSTYYGGIGNDVGRHLACDASDNLYVAGVTTSTNFPTLNPGGGAYFQGALGGGYDIGLVKFNPAGVLLWGTYYGGTSNEYIAWKESVGVRVDAADNLWMHGVTLSTNMPTLNPGGGAYFQAANAGSYDGFIAKFSNPGALLWATYIGGTGSDRGFAVDFDSFDNAYLVGLTASTNFPTLNPGGGAYFQAANGGTDDLYITKFTNAGVMTWSTYYGGTGLEYVGADAIKLTLCDHFFIGGVTRSANLPVFNPGGTAYFDGAIGGAEDNFLVKFDNLSAMQWGTYYGGSSLENGTWYWEVGLSSDGVGALVCVGTTSSTDFPTLNPGGGAFYQAATGGGQDMWIARFSYDGTRLWSTYCGGTSSDFGSGMTTDGANNFFVTGEWNSLTSNGIFNPGGGAYFQGGNAGSHDVFIQKFSPIALGPSCTIILTVEMLEFTGKLTSDNKVQLDWMTATEINNDYFNVQRMKLDGNQNSGTSGIWEIIGTVAGAGNSNDALSYSFIDERPHVGMNHYRLSQVDYNGSENVSSVIGILVDGPQFIVGPVVPNPAANSFTNSLYAVEDGAVLIQVFDIIGKLVLQHVVLVTEGENNIYTDVSTLPKGIYHLRVSTEADVAVVPFVK